MSVPREIVGSRIHATSYARAVDRIAAWARAGESRAVFAANVHLVMEAHDDPAFRSVVNRADLVTPDGMPLVWGLRMLGVRGATRVYGPDLTLAVCARAERDGIPVGFYGGAPQTLERLLAALRARFPRLIVPYAFSPPFRPPSAAEDAEVVEQIARSGTRILFVGLGCPRQERWVDSHRGRVPAVMLAVGAAFDFISGAKRQAPRWMMRAGLEWAFRLGSEPGRLWRRYLRYNPRFLAAFAGQLARGPGNGLQAARGADDTDFEGPSDVRASSQRRG